MNSKILHNNQGVNEQLFDNFQNNFLKLPEKTIAIFNIRGTKGLQAHFLSRTTQNIPSILLNGYFRYSGFIDVIFQINNNNNSQCDPAYVIFQIVRCNFKTPKRGLKCHENTEKQARITSKHPKNLLRYEQYKDNQSLHNIEQLPETLA